MQKNPRKQNKTTREKGGGAKDPFVPKAIDTTFPPRRSNLDTVDKVKWFRDITVGLFHFIRFEEREIEGSKKFAVSVVLYVPGIYSVFFDEG